MSAPMEHTEECLEPWECKPGACTFLLDQLRAENKKFREFIKGVKEFDPRSDIYDTGLMHECNDVLGLCRCCGEKECEETDEV